ncbi:MAG: FHA domain-containing protein [Anaerolineales bacterium]|nr:FHA domain-containing protein [Anaerolineales bacterium]
MQTNTPPTITLTWQDVRTRQEMAFRGALPITIGRAAADNMIALESRLVSSQHARLEQQNGRIQLRDLASHNGTAVEGFPISQPTTLTNGSRFQIGAFSFVLTTGDEAPRQRQPAAPKANPSPDLPTQVLPPPFAAQAQQAQFPPASFQQKKVPLQQLMAETAVETTTYLAIGGGLGSFSWVDHLVICGANPADIVSIGFEAKPYGRYQRLCQHSQIPDHERLRSNSDSCPDNIWGWPGYAVRELWQEAAQGHLGQAAKIGWQLFNEPFVQTYTPRAGAVFAAIDREANRIGWQRIWRQGRVRAIRQTDDGRFIVAYSQLNPDGTSRHRLIVAPYLHLAVGYPGVRFLPDLQKYRQETGDFAHVVNAYEDHDHVYEALARQGGTVLIRGRGIVASRLIQRLYEVRQQSGQPIKILHLMRQPNEVGGQFQYAQREVRNHWEHQPFNWPKAAWGGDLRQMLADGSTQTRGDLLAAWGGTTTADRTDWQEIIEQGLAAGWYEIQFGQVASVALGNGRLQTSLIPRSGIANQIRLLADFIIDATGLESGIDDSPLLRDLASHYQLPRNAQNRLKVSNQFELTALRNGAGRAYASGIATLGGPFAAVDSFLGLQYAALCATDDLIAHRAPGLQRLNGFRSLHQWLRWAKGDQP